MVALCSLFIVATPSPLGLKTLYCGSTHASLQTTVTVVTVVVYCMALTSTHLLWLRFGLQDVQAQRGSESDIIIQSLYRGRVDNQSEYMEEKFIS